MPNRVLIARELADLFKLLAHPDRIRLIEELGAGEKAVKSRAFAPSSAATATAAAASAAWK